MSARNVCILLLENDEADVFLFRRALAQLRYAGDVRVVGSVSEARAYLEGWGAFHDRKYYPYPDLIVSDMNMPGETGNAFLQWLRTNHRFTHIPFVFLSGSYLPPDKILAEQLGASSFFRKSGDIAEIKERIAHMLKFLPFDKGSGIGPDSTTG
jgi:CheY-like chemotaxis protein